MESFQEKTSTLSKIQNEFSKITYLKSNNINDTKEIFLESLRKQLFTSFGYHPEKYTGNAEEVTRLTCDYWVGKMGELE